MIGDYIKDPSCGLGKVIKLRPETYFICPYINRKEAAWLI